MQCDVGVFLKALEKCTYGCLEDVRTHAVQRVFELLLFVTVTLVHVFQIGPACRVLHFRWRLNLYDFESERVEQRCSEHKST